VAVLECTRLAFVGIADQILLARQGTRHEAPLQAGGEARTATAAQRRRLDFSNDVIGRHSRGQDLAQGFVAAALDVVFQTPVRAVDPFQDLRADVAVVEDHAGGEVSGGIRREPLRVTLQKARRAHADSPCFLSSSIISSILPCSMRTHMCRLFSNMTGESPQAPMHSPSISVNMPSGVVSW